jgi:hypothetical protein
MYYFNHLAKFRAGYQFFALTWEASSHIQKCLYHPVTEQFLTCTGMDRFDDNPGEYSSKEVWSIDTIFTPVTFSLENIYNRKNIKCLSMMHIYSLKDLYIFCIEPPRQQK